MLLETFVSERTRYARPAPPVASAAASEGQLAPDALDRYPTARHVAVVRLGYVGRPSALGLSHAGYQVTGLVV
jgi:hypothetical protein